MELVKKSYKTRYRNNYIGIIYVQNLIDYINTYNISRQNLRTKFTALPENKRSILLIK